MRNLIIALGILVMVSSSKGQDISEKDVPETVKTKFTSLYPFVTKVKWEIEHGKYEAEFKENTIEKSVIFQPDGTYVQTEIEIPVSTLPAAINEYLEKELLGKKIKEASEITSADGTVSYEAEIGKTDFLFDANGKLLRSESENNDDDK